jgi:hypothetical protein
MKIITVYIFKKVGELNIIMPVYLFHPLPLIHALLIQLRNLINLRR